jgi:hypothetical protein
MMGRYCSGGLSAAVIVGIGLGAQGVLAAEVNLYSSRHYDTDIAL